MSIDRLIRTSMWTVGLGIIMHGSFRADAQTLGATLVESSKVTDLGLEFDNFQFGSSISPHGDCIDVINGYVFVTWYRGGMDDRHVMLSRKKIGSGTWKTIEFPHQHVGYRGDPTIGDAHNTIAVTVCPIDNTVHMLYDMHAYNPSELPDDYFNYSVSIPNAAFVPDDQFTIDLFLPKQNELESEGNYIDITYPKFNRTDDGTIIANWRKGGAGSGDTYYAFYNGSAWSEPILFGNGRVADVTQRWSIYGKLKYEGGNLGYGFAIRWGGQHADDIPYNSGFYYAEAKAPYGADDWYDIDGNPITIPVTNPDVIKVGEPTDFGVGNEMTSGADWTRTKNGAVHFMTVVSGNFVHYYRPVGSNTFITDLNSPLSDMIPAGEYALMADTVGGRPYIRVAPEGTKNWQVIHDENSGPSMDYYVVDMEGDTLVYYSRQPGSTTTEPLHVTVYTLDIPGIDNPDYTTEPTSGQVAHWPLDEMSGTVVTNLADSSYMAHLENGATWGSDATRDSYVVFDGTDDRIATTFSYALADTNDFTWAWWAKKQSAPGADNSSIMVGNRYGGTGSETLEFIKMTPQGAEFANTGSAAAIEKYDYADIPQNAWHHYAMVKDGTNCQWYVDGVAQGVASNFNYNEVSPIPFMIGGDGDNKPNEHFQGCIDDVVLYREALTPQEISNVMNGAYVPHDPPTISAILDQTILADSNTGPLAFMVGDDMTAPGSLTLAGISSNTDLVPVENIVFGGSDSNRTVTVTPLPNQSGSALIGILVNDGSLSSTNSFSLTVWPAGTVSASVTNNTPGTVMWTCPTGVTNIQVECWGGGGAGGSSSTTGGARVYVAGGGGAGGAFARKASVPVTPGMSYSVTIGDAAVAADPVTATTGDRVNGADISFTGDSGVTVLAKGGQGGECVINPAITTGGAGGLGSSAGCVGDSVFAGGSGYTALTKGGSGGGGAGDSANGEDATLSDAGDPDSATLPGAGGTNGGGEGGLGAPGVDVGGDASNPGGGGSGARTGKYVVSSGADLQKFGGTGGLGQIILSYVQLPADETPALTHSMSGGDMVFNWAGSGFKVQSCTNLVEGTWQDVPGGDTPPVTNSTTDPECFFRLIEH